MARCDIRDFGTCTGCGACASVCARGALLMAADPEEGFLYPQIDASRCTRCGACYKVCPVDRATERPWRESLAAFNTDAAVRARSSSGGVFTALAEGVLARGGMVFGAALKRRAPAEGGGLHLRHIGLQNPELLGALRGSKYLQSDTADALTDAKHWLDTGMEVLFSGTPCQIAGLYAMLKKTYPNLLTVDFVCHGVPSPMVFDAYQRGLEAGGRRITELAFRDKRRGWKDFCLAVNFEDGKDYAAGQTEDPYMIAFLRNLCLRPSCHVCPYAGEKRQADLTLADLWGAQHILPDWDDDLGLSLVLVGSERGAAALEALGERLRTAPVQAAACARDNPSIFRPAVAHARRDAFLRHVRRRGFARVEKKFFAPPSLLQRAAGKARRVLSAAKHRLGLS